MGQPSVGATTEPARRRSRREEILAVAVRLFAERGYHGVSMDDVGVAAGVTGPALYHHFAGKEAMLAAALTPVSQALLAGGVARVEGSGDAATALAALVDFHVAFALDNPAVISLHLNELARMPQEARQVVRRLQRLYVEQWVSVLVALRPQLSRGEARVLAHAAFGLMNSTPFLSGEIENQRCAQLLRAAALACLSPGGAAARPSSGAVPGGDGDWLVTDPDR